MATAAIIQKVIREPLTLAGRTYLTNVEQFAAMMAMMSRAMLSRLAEPAIGTQTTSRQAKTLPSLRTASDPSFLHLCYVVMLVTFGEAFLHDGLAECALADRSIMGNSEQRASYSEVVALGTFEAVERELRSRWARNFVDDGGPKRWIARLSKMFGGEYPADLVVQMEEAWGVRHMVVHHAGVATADFVMRHPRLTGVAGQRLSLPLQLVLDYAEAIGRFVRVTDNAVGRRIKGNTPKSTKF